MVFYQFSKQYIIEEEILGSSNTEEIFGKQFAHVNSS